MPAPQENNNASKFSMDTVKAIIKAIAEGANIKDACEDNKISFQSWCNWKRENEVVFDLYARAREDKAEWLESEIDRIMGLLEKETISPASANVLIQTLKWKLSKFYPKMFGDKIDVTSGQEKIRTFSLSEVEKELKELLSDDN